MKIECYLIGSVVDRFGFPKMRIVEVVSVFKSCNDCHIFDIACFMEERVVDTAYALRFDTVSVWGIGDNGLVVFKLIMEAVVFFKADNIVYSCVFCVLFCDRYHVWVVVESKNSIFLFIDLCFGVLLRFCNIISKGKSWEVFTCK